MIMPNDTTVAVVDGTRMRLFRNKGVEPHIRLVPLTDPRSLPSIRGRVLVIAALRPTRTQRG